MTASIEFITLIINIFFAYFFSNIFLASKELNKKNIIGLVGVSSIICTVCHLLWGITLNEIGIIITFLIIIFAFNERLIFKVLLIILFMLLTYNLEVFIEFSVSIIYRSNYTDFFITNFELYNLTLALLRVLVLLIFNYLSKLKVINEKIYLKDLSRKYILTLSFILVSSLVFTVLVDYMLSDISFRNYNIPVAFLFFTLFMGSIIMIGVLIMVQKNYKENLLKSNTELLQLQLKNQLSHYNQMKEYLEETRKLKHDLHNHMHSLKYLIKKAAYEDALKYIYDINDSMHKLTFEIDTGSVIFDAIYIEKNKVAMEKDIELINIKCMNQELAIKSFDLCVIVSNSLDNAIEACSELADNSKKKILVESYIKNNHWIYRVTNSSKHVKITDNFVDTSKGDKLNHGYGIRNMKEIVVKYDGGFNIEYSDDLFVLEIVMKNKA